MRARALWLALLCALCACGEDGAKLTQIVVVVEGDLRVPDELDELSISVDGVLQMPKAEVALSAQAGLPRSLGLVHAGGPLGPVRVTVRGRRAGANVVVRAAEVSFQAQQTLKLALPLTRSCAQARLSCTADETCDAGRCVPQRIASLPTFDGTLGGAGMLGSAGARATGGAGAGGRPAAAGGAGGKPTPGTGGAGSAASGGNASAGGAGGDGDSERVNEPPSCSIETPLDGAKYYHGDTISFRGSCVDPEDGTQYVMTWRSDRDGLLGLISSIAEDDLSTGEHVISLCADDDEDQTGCAATVTISVEPLPAVTASITQIAQGSATSGIYSSDQISATGSGSGVAPLTLSWTDSLLGDLGTGEDIALSAPVPAGKHTLLLRVTDERGRSASTSGSFTVRPASSNSLFEPYSVVNSVLGSTGGLTALAAIGSRVHIGAGSGVVYAFDATSAPGTAPTTLEVTTAPDTVRDISIHSASGFAYLSTNAGVRECSLSGNNITDTCTSIKDAPLPGNDVKSTLRVTAAQLDYLIVGTTAGLLVAERAGLANPKPKADALVTRMAASASVGWLATGTGLQSFDLTKVLGTPRTYSGSPSGLTALALGTGQVWVGGSAGIARYDIAGNSWSSWNVTTTNNVAIGQLVSNDVRALAVTRPTLAGSARDVIWIATSAGLSRYDTSIRSFTTYTMDDGLPHNSVRALLTLSSGELLIGTDGGLAIHRGT